MLTDAYPKSTTLKDGSEIIIRPLDVDDTEPLLRFFRGLPEEERIFLRHDVCDPDVIHSWTHSADPSRVVSLIAIDDGEIVGDGTLHVAEHQWMRHVADIRLVTAATHRRMGLGAVLARELVALAEERQIEKIRAQVIADNVGGIRMFEAVGFNTAAVLPGMIKDRGGHPRNLVFMVNDVADLSRLMEDWIQSSMVPAYRVPGGGE